MKNGREVCQEVLDSIKRGNYIELKGEDLKLRTKNFQGNLYLEALKASTDLTINPEKFVVNVEEGDLGINIDNLKSEGVIRLAKGSLNLRVSNRINANIFLLRDKSFHKGKFEPGRPTLILDLGEVQVDIQINEPLSFADMVKQRVEARKKAETNA
jgi:hypothetical protein